jgi:hypothetical protein
MFSCKNKAGGRENKAARLAHTIQQIRKKDKIFREIASPLPPLPWACKPAKNHPESRPERKD